MNGPVWLASYVALWGAVVVLSLVLLALLRQIGVLHERLAPATGGAVGDGLAIGSAAPMPGRLGYGRAKATLLVFTSAGSQACERLGPLLETVERQYKGVRIVEVPYSPRTRDVFAACNVTSTPRLIAVDRAGVVRACALARTLEQVEELLAAALDGEPVGAPRLVKDERRLRASEVSAAEPGAEAASASATEVAEERVEEAGGDPASEAAVPDDAPEHAAAADAVTEVAEAPVADAAGAPDAAADEASTELAPAPASERDAQGAAPDLEPAPERPTEPEAASGPGPEPEPAAQPARPLPPRPAVAAGAPNRPPVQRTAMPKPKSKPAVVGTPAPSAAGPASPVSPLTAKAPGKGTTPFRLPTPPPAPLPRLAVVPAQRAEPAATPAEAAATPADDEPAGESAGATA